MRYRSSRLNSASHSSTAPAARRGFFWGVSAKHCIARLSAGATDGGLLTTAVPPDVAMAAVVTPEPEAAPRATCWGVGGGRCGGGCGSAGKGSAGGRLATASTGTGTGTEVGGLAAGAAQFPGGTCHGCGCAFSGIGGLGAGIVTRPDGMPLLFGGWLTLPAGAFPRNVNVPDGDEAALPMPPTLASESLPAV